MTLVREVACIIVVYFQLSCPNPRALADSQANCFEKVCRMNAMSLFMRQRNSPNPRLPRLVGCDSYIRRESRRRGYPPIDSFLS
ncbi:hypothetical protein BKA67DRAFT_35067 [Truncatella angustata]|uniref:Uncharacterized protein n=1 Tax=Truncatella angustata TaxID=152316 RepID=A0A9P8UX43_9PEZI|nr:uncharacterized protein BKA67DRAFT_35067 [Truncatella angustata]KAH6659980.1 hypothetical protein BKA67DRAFT_35067 [Truncatella angustata]